MSITEFTKENVSKFKQEFADAVKDLCEKHNISIDLPNRISFGPNDFSPKLSIRIKNPKSGVLIQSTVPGLIADDQLVGKTFKNRYDSQRTLTVTAINGEDVSIISNRGKRFRVTKTRLLSDEFTLLY